MPKAVLPNPLAELEREAARLAALSLPTPSLDVTGVQDLPFVDDLFSTASSLLGSNSNTPPGDARLLLIPQGYPVTLPAPAVLFSIVETFLSSVHPAATSFSAARFRQRLSLPPTHHHYPHESLLHAVVALTIDLYGDAVLREQPFQMYQYLGEAPAKWHNDKATEMAVAAASGRDKLLDVLQVRLAILGSRINLNLTCKRQAFGVVTHYLHRNCLYVCRFLLGPIILTNIMIASVRSGITRACSCG